MKDYSIPLKKDYSKPIEDPGSITAGPFNNPVTNLYNKVLGPKKALIDAGTPLAYQTLGNMVGEEVGALATVPTGGIINPISGAALGGTLLPGAGEAYRQFANKEPFSGGKVLGEIKNAGLREIGGRATIKALEVGGPMIEDALTNAFQSSDNKLSGLSQELLARADEAKKTIGAMLGGAVDSDGESLVDSEKFNQIINNPSLPQSLRDEMNTNPELQRQTVGQVEKGQFVMGPASRQVSPQITRIQGAATSDVPIEPTYDPNAGKYINEIVTPSKTLNNPEDIVALHSPGEGVTPRRITTISPKETYQIRPEVKGVSSMTPGEEVISPTLKNSETARGILKGKVPTSHFKPKYVPTEMDRPINAAYDEMGTLMREGRPEIGEAQGLYAKASNGADFLKSKLMDPQGFFKGKPLLDMFGKGGTEGDQAIADLVEHNPEIAGTVKNIKAYSQHLKNIALAKKLFTFGLAGGALKGGENIAGKGISEIAQHVLGD